MSQLERVLIVDDVPAMRELLKAILTEFGVKYIDEAENAKIAMKLFDVSEPEIVFLDINLPDGSGLEILGKMKLKRKKAYVTMVSGESSIANVKESIRLGAKGFVVKPFQKEKIMEIIQGYLISRYKPESAVDP